MRRASGLTVRHESGTKVAGHGPDLCMYASIAEAVTGCDNRVMLRNRVTCPSTHARKPAFAPTDDRLDVAILGL